MVVFQVCCLVHFLLLISQLNSIQTCFISPCEVGKIRYTSTINYHTITNVYLAANKGNCNKRIARWDQKVTINDTGQKHYFVSQRGKGRKKSATYSSFIMHIRSFTVFHIYETLIEREKKTVRWLTSLPSLLTLSIFLIQ